MQLAPNTARRLERHLDSLLERRDPGEHLANDPVSRVRKFDTAENREVVGLIASSLAYGQVTKVLEAIDRALRPLGESPADALRRRRDWRSEVDGYRYRMTGSEDLADLYAAIAQTLRTEGSLEDLYLDADTGSHLDAASTFVRRLRQRRLREECHRGLRYLLPDPSDGSACKRLHMFFRWMGRGPDAIDPGSWSSLAPSALLVPLDTHTSRICRYIGLTDRKSVDGKMAADVTDSLRQLDPEDPTRYDFALAHMGIADDCIHERSEHHCPDCPIEPVCTLE